MVICSFDVPRKHKGGEDMGKDGRKHILFNPFLTVSREEGENEQNLQSILEAPTLSFLTSQPTKRFFKTSFS